MQNVNVQEKDGCFVIECPECENGKTEVVDFLCHKPTSECCGACTVTIDCVVCGGSNELQSEPHTEYYFLMIMALEGMKPQMNEYTQKLIDDIVYDNLTELTKYYAQ